MKKIIQTLKEYKSIIAVIIIGALYKSTLFSAEGDTLWHIKDGLRMLNTMQIKESVDTFSWYAAEQGLSQIKHSWLGSILVALNYKIFGGLGIDQKVFGITLAFILFAVILLGYKKHTKELTFMELMMCVTPLLITLTYSARPRDLTYIFFAYLIMLLEDISQERIEKRFIIKISLLTLLWANIHGSTVLLIPVYLTAYLTASLFDIDKGRIQSLNYTKWYRGNIEIAIGASLLVGMINPYGYKLYTYPFSGNTEECKAYIFEWSTANIDNALIAFIMLIVAIMAILLTNKKYKLEEAIPFASMFLASLKYIRFIPYLAIAFAILMIKHAKDLRNKKYVEENKVKHIGIFSSLVCIFLIVALITIFKDKEDKEAVPKDVIEYIKENDIDRMYNGYNEGAYLIWNDIPCFVDSRADFYDKEALAISKDVQAKEYFIDKEGTVEKFKFNHWLLHTNSYLYFILEKQYGFEVEYTSKDNNYSIVKLNQ